MLKGKATQDVASALQGTIPGLTITRSSSRPGNEGTSITLRGGISVNEMSPMIVIDGVEAYSWELSQINPNDIESVSVLKDAAAAIYGTKAGAGVILVTTKRGKEGKAKITYSGSVHANLVGKRFPVASGQEWAEMLIEATTNDAYAYLKNGEPQWNWWMWPEETWRTMAAGERYEGVVGGLWRVLDPTSDQFDAVYGTTWGQSHTVTISGGSDKVKAMTSLGYANDRSLIDLVYDGQKNITSVPMLIIRLMIGLKPNLICPMINAIRVHRNKVLGTVFRTSISSRYTMSMGNIMIHSVAITYWQNLMKEVEIIIRKKFSDSVENDIGLKQVGKGIEYYWKWEYPYASS